jgi:heme/copper-type cytochrome/quinol oxidase subunit 2
MSPLFAAAFAPLSHSGGWVMMAFVFFLVWMLASITLLTVWVFRQNPSSTPASPTGAREATPVEV